MRGRIFLKLLAAFLLVIATVTAALGIAMTRVWQRSLREEIKTSLTRRARLLALRVADPQGRPLQQLVEEQAAAAEARVTVIERSGRVLADSAADPASMENHAARQEFAAALQGRVGTDTRKSATVGMEYLYVALPVGDGAVRLAYPLSAIERTTSSTRRTLWWSAGLAVLGALLISAAVARSTAQRLERIEGFAERIAAGDLTARIAESSSDEIGKLAAALDGTANRLQQNFRDLQSSRQQLETVLNGMQEAVIAVSADGRVRWANGRMATLTPGGVRLGASVVETVRDPDFLRAIQDALSKGEIQVTRATSIAPGRYYDVTATPMPGEGAVAVLHDVTGIERVEKTRRDFIANVSHELRTPLTSIQGYAETLLETSDCDGEREFLEIIRKNAARMSRLTEDLLALARVESGETAFALKPVAPAELLAEAAQEFGATCRSRGIDLTVQCDSQRLARADRDAIHQVLINLIDNAVKYGASGQAIVIGARDAGSNVEFYVRDFGAGIASEHVPRLFERFYRVDKARSRESGGTGLGLAIAKHIVRAHGGTIRAESELGHGSSFIFGLPVSLPS